MHRICSRISIAVLTFIIGLSGVWLNSLYPKFEDFLVEKLSSTPDLDTYPKFTLMISACGEKGSFRRYSTLDGHILERSGELFDSTALAAEVLERKANFAQRIVERNPVFNEKGQQVGERVVAIISSNRAAIFGTHDSVFWSIDAPSLEYALAFEKENYTN